MLVEVRYRTGWSECMMRYSCSSQDRWLDVTMEADGRRAGWLKARVEVPDGSGGIMEFVMHNGRGTWDNPPDWYGHRNYQVPLPADNSPALLIVTLSNGTIDAVDVPQDLAPAVAETSVGAVAGLTQCSVCFGDYHHEDLHRQPQVLRCGEQEAHTDTRTHKGRRSQCRGFIDHHPRGRRRAVCPTCRVETPEADVHINYGLRDILEKLLTATAAAAPASATNNTTHPHPTPPAPPIPPSSHDALVPPRQRQQQADGQDDTNAIAPPSRTPASGGSASVSRRAGTLLSGVEKDGVVREGMAGPQPSGARQRQRQRQQANSNLFIIAAAHGAQQASVLRRSGTLPLSPFVSDGQDHHHHHQHQQRQQQQQRDDRHEGGVQRERRPHRYYRNYGGRVRERGTPQRPIAEQTPTNRTGGSASLHRGVQSEEVGRDATAGPQPSRTQRQGPQANNNPLAIAAHGTQQASVSRCSGTLPCGVPYEVVREGSGRTPTAFERVTYDDIAWTDRFEGNRIAWRNSGAECRVSDWSEWMREALLEMREGEVRRVNDDRYGRFVQLQLVRILDR
ncbi:unnamed protein product [Vitrella brassicaformis CCMP3155]|uniref:CBM20 domain-containing protein n=2 Tax=Vitrella brassicaformis TaxID=1169539 RepID=A0A0G4EVZ8_VITBC|nr:unnamed protein product [Vitrella brassicaformis CCMP3155]|eukprot:CEM02272.1 unnamed protein product [Vitrella brassicaformis CCMP3155]